MENRKYVGRIADDNIRDRFYESIGGNQIKDFYESSGKGHTTYAYLINQCSLFIEDNSDRNNLDDLKIDIFHENSLDKIIETKGVVEKKSGLVLEERK